MTITIKEPNVSELVKQTGDAIKEVSKNGTDTELQEKVAELSHELKQYKEQANALYTSKMEFEQGQRNDNQFSDKQLADAYMMAKAQGVDVFDTELGSKMKAITTVAAFQTGFTNTVQGELEQELKVAPLFKQIKVNQKSLNYPVTNESTNRSSVFPNGVYAVHPDESTNVAVGYQTTVSGVSLIPHKFMSRTWLAKDEEEDSVLELASIQRNNAVHMLARDIDRAILRGDGSLSAFTATPTGYQAPFKGFVQLADDVAGAGLEVNTNSNTAYATSTSIASARGKLGKYGVSGSNDLAYFTTVEGYNELIQDANSMTMDKVGPVATLLTGQVGFIWGIPVIITEYLDNTGIDKTIGAMVYRPNWVVGKGRKISLETEYKADKQITDMFVSARLDFKPLATVASGALSNSYSMASVVKTKAT